VATAVAAAATDAKVAPPDRDPRVSAAARELAAFLPDNVVPPHDVTSFTLSWFGIIESTAHIVVTLDAARDTAGIASAARVTVAGILPHRHYRRVGVGAAAIGDAARVVIALQESAVTTEPIPRMLPPNGTAVVRGRVAPPLRDPHIYVARPSGEVTTPPTSLGKSGGFAAELRCERDVGALQVEIAADDPNTGALVVANFPVWCAVLPPRSHRVARSETVSGDPHQVEQEIYELMNRDRAEAGLAPLVWDDTAAAAARAHSEDMRDEQFVGHVSPKAGGTEDRTRRAGLRSPLIVENVALDYSARAAEADLMASPGHRANILRANANRAGVGVALGSRSVSGRTEVYVTQLLFQRLPALDERAARATFQGTTAAMRAKEGLPALEEDWALRNIAEDYARALAVGGDADKDRAAAQASRALEQLGARFRSVVTVVQVITGVADLKDAAMLDPEASVYGLGVAQGNDVSLGDGALFAVLLVARTR